MKNKMLVEIYFPACGRTFEFRIPRAYYVFQVNELLIRFFAEHPVGGYVPDENSMLCDAETGRILNANLSISQLERMDNPKLMLI